MQQIAEGSKSYKRMHARWPAVPGDFVAPEFDLWTLDFWNRPFIYLPYDPAKGWGAVLSYGADGRPGGTGLDEDLELRFDWTNCSTKGFRTDQTNSYCIVHGDPMRPDEVPIIYGYVECTMKGFGEGEAELFPNTNTWDAGGDCVIESPQKRKVSYCPSCRHERSKWIEQHDKDPQP